MLSRLSIFSAIIAAALICGFTFFNENKKQKQRIEELQQTEKILKTHLDAITNLNKKNNWKTVELLAAQQAVQLSLSSQRAETRRLQSEVQEIKEWANNALPADIVRLRQRPAITGAGIYSERVPPSGTVRIESQQSTN